MSAQNVRNEMLDILIYQRGPSDRFRELTDWCRNHPEAGIKILREARYACDVNRRNDLAPLLDNAIQHYVPPPASARAEPRTARPTHALPKMQHSPPTPVSRKGSRLPRNLHDQMMKAVGDGDRDLLKHLIEHCRAYDDGLSTLCEAVQKCPSRWHALHKDLAETIKAWQPPRDDLVQDTAATLQKSVSRKGSRLPRNLHDEMMKAVQDGDRDRLKRLIESCKTYDNGLSVLSEARRKCPPRFSELYADLNEAVIAWLQPPGSVQGVGFTMTAAPQVELSLPLLGNLSTEELRNLARDRGIPPFLGRFDLICRLHGHARWYIASVLILTKIGKITKPVGTMAERRFRLMAYFVGLPLRGARWLFSLVVLLVAKIVLLPLNATRSLFSKSSNSRGLTEADMERLARTAGYKDHASLIAAIKFQQSRKGRAEARKLQESLERVAAMTPIEDKSARPSPTDEAKSPLERAMTGLQHSPPTPVSRKGSRLPRNLEEDTTDELISASVFGRLDIVRALLARGADVNKKDRWGSTALLSAADRPTSDTVKMLLAAGADINAQDENGRTVLMLAARAGQADTIKLLIGAHADVNKTSKSNETALMLAAGGDHADVVNALITAGANINAQDENGRTALMYVARSNSDKLVSINTLISAGIGLHIKDSDGLTALELAGLNGNIFCHRAIGAAIASSKGGIAALITWAFGAKTADAKLKNGEVRDASPPTSLDRITLQLTTLKICPIDSTRPTHHLVKIIESVKDYGKGSLKVVNGSFVIEYKRETSWHGDRNESSYHAHTIRIQRVSRTTYDMLPKDSYVRDVGVYG